MRAFKHFQKKLNQTNCPKHDAYNQAKMIIETKLQVIIKAYRDKQLAQIKQRQKTLLEEKLAE